MIRASLAVLLCLSSAVPAAAALSCPAAGLDKTGKGSVLLFSALPLGETKFAARWKKARPELVKEFPGLRFEKPENLHVTLVFVGMGWDPEKIPEMEKYSLNGPDLSSGPLKMKGTPDLFGPSKQVVALHLNPVPSEWETRLMKDRETMTGLGLRSKDRYDDQFKAHISLASSATPDVKRDELARFQKWMTDHASRFGGLELPIDRSVKPKFMVVLGKDEDTRFVPLHGYCKE